MPSPRALDLDLLFSLSNGLALVAWLALAASPFGVRWAAHVRLFAGRVVPLVFAVIYAGLFATTSMAGGGYGTLDEVRRLMAVPALLTAGWLHYLAFDLFVGVWIAERAGRLGVPHLVLVPLLALTFMFGPAGLLAFAALRWLWLRRQPATAPA